MNLKIFTDNVEEKALRQIHTLCEHPAFSDCKVRIMPDVHAGAGCVIGFTADLGNKVIPNVVGVDIGCGMLTVCLGNIDIDFNKLDSVIRENVPSGMQVHESVQAYVGSIGLKCWKSLRNVDWLNRSLGTLGGGNHFIEIDEDDECNKYLVIHTGSRNLGKQVCEYYQNHAISNIVKNKLRNDIAELVKEYKNNGRDSEIENAIKKLKSERKEYNIPKELCYLVGLDREDYLHDMKICQRFAELNRYRIAKAIMDNMAWEMLDSFETVHNYIGDDNIVRKGAIAAYKGQRVLIPMNMRDGCIIGIGKGNEDWNFSAPHGAGRIMSRNAARENISMEEYKSSMKDIYSTCVNKSTIDESPMAYKPMEEIVENIKDTVEIERIIKPIYNFKAGED
jgi:RNA-splicing ligase RtcB